MSVNPLIDHLVNDLAPRKSMTFRRLESYAVILFAMVLAFILLTLKIRPDYKEALQTGSMIWKPGVLFLCAMSLTLLLGASSLPGRSIKRIYLLPMIIAVAFFSFLFIQMLIISTKQDFIIAITDHRAPFCLGFVSLFGGIIMTALWQLWIKKSAPENSRRTGMIAGICSGFIAASAYAFHCGADSPLYMLIYYGVPIMTLGLVGNFLGKKYLNW